VDRIFIPTVSCDCLSYITANRLTIYDSRVKGSNEILLRLEEIFSNIKHMETNVRNYVITGRVIEGSKCEYNQADLFPFMGKN
jgi:hypothetical protein